MTRFYSPIEKSVRMKMSFYKLLIISNLWGYLTACHAGGREFEPRPHRSKGSKDNFGTPCFLLLFQGVHLLADELGPLGVGLLRGKGLPGDGLADNHLEVLAAVAEKFVREGEHF